MHRFRSRLALALFLLAAGAAGQAAHSGTPDFLFEIPPVTGNTGESVAIAVLLDNNGPDLSAWSVAVCHDVDASTLLAAEAGATTLVANGGSAPAFSELTVYEDGFVAGVIIHLFGANGLAPGVDYELYTATYSIAALAPATVPIEFCDDTLPLISNRVVDTNGDGFTPEFAHGAIDVVGPAPLHFRFSAGEHTAYYDNEDGEASVAVPLSILEEATDVDFPQGIEAFAMALRHPEPYLTAVAVEIAAPLAAANGGAGPELFVAEFLADGVFVDVVVTSAGAGFVAETATEAVVVTYETVPLVFQFNVFGIDLELEWADDLPPPAAPNSVEVGGYFIGMLEPVDGLLHFERRQKLRRGDANEDGALGLADAIATLSYLFDGGVLDCLDAADSNDSHSVDIADPIHLLAYLFQLGDPPAPPFPDCDFDATGNPACVDYGACP